MKRLLLLLVASLGLLATVVASAGAAAPAGVMSYALNPTIATETVPGIPTVCGGNNVSISQTYRPTDFGVSGPYRLASIAGAWQGGTSSFVHADDAAGRIVGSFGSSSRVSEDVTRPFEIVRDEELPFMLAPSGSTLTVEIMMLSNPWWGWPEPLVGVNLDGAVPGSPQPMVTDCRGTRPLSAMTPGTLPWTVKIVPLSREDLASQTRLQLTASGFGLVNAGQVNALAQQAANGDLDAYLLSMHAIFRRTGWNLVDYLAQYARLLQGTTTVGYPA